MQRKRCAVKRQYDSQLRADQARRTRRLIVAAAAQLFVDQGFGTTTIDAVAAAAGVSRKTVFDAVGGKAELLRLALEWAQVNDDQPIPLADRPDARQIGRHTDPEAIIAAYVAVICDIDSRVAPLSHALLVAAGVDNAIRILRDELVAQRWTGARAFVQHLANHGGVNNDLPIDTAADIAWLHSDPLIYHRLVIERRWLRERFSHWLHHALTTQLQHPAPSPVTS